MGSGLNVLWNYSEMFFNCKIYNYYRWYLSFSNRFSYTAHKSKATILCLGNNNLIRNTSNFSFSDIIARKTLTILLYPFDFNIPIQKYSCFNSLLIFRSRHFRPRDQLRPCVWWKPASRPHILTLMYRGLPIRRRRTVKLWNVAGSAR